MKYSILFFLLLSGYAHALSITVTADERCPYTCKDDADKKGFLIDIVTHVFNKEGYEVDYKTSPSHEQAIKDVKDDKFNAVIGTSKKKAPGLLYTKSPLAYSYDVILVAKYSHWKYTSPDSFHELVLGAEKGLKYADEVNQYIMKHKDDPTKVCLSSGKYALKHNLKGLRFDKITAMVSDHATVRYFYFQKKKPFRFKIARTYPTDAVYIAFSPHNYRSKKYADMFYKGLQQLKGSKAMKNILLKYGLNEAYIRPPNTNQ